MLPRPLPDDRRGRRATWRRTAVLVLLAAAAGGFAGATWGAGQEATHQATAVVVVNPLEGNPFSPDGRGDDLVNLETEAQLVRSSRMGSLVAEALGTGDTPADLVESVSVEVPPNTQLLQITADGVDDASARARAQAFAESYLDYRAARTEAVRFDRAAQLEEQIRDRTAEQEGLVKDLRAAPPRSGEAAVLTQRVVNLTAQVDELRAQLASATPSAPDPGQLVTPAASSAHGLPGGPRTAIGLGVLLGCLAGWVLAAAAGRLDGVVRSAGDLADSTVPVLSTLGYAASPADDARLRAALLARTDRRPLTVLVSAAGAATDGPRTGRRLAASVASSHVRAVVVDMSSPLSGLGLSDLLVDETTLGRVLTRTGSHLELVTAGTAPATLDDLAASPEAEVLLHELRVRADLVVLCCPGPESQITQALAGRADLVLLEAHVGHSRRVDLDLAAELLISVGAAELHTVLIGPPTRTHRRVRVAVRRTAARVRSALRRGLARSVLGPLARHGGSS